MPRLDLSVSARVDEHVCSVCELPFGEVVLSIERPTRAAAFFAAWPQVCPGCAGELERLELGYQYADGLVGGLGW